MDSPAIPAPIIPPALVEDAKADRAAHAPGAAAPAPPVDWTAEGRELVEFALALLVPLSPSLAGVYPATVREQLGGHLGAVLKKHDVTVAILFGRWAPEFGLLIVAAPLIAPTVAAVRADRAAKLTVPAAVTAPATVPGDSRTSPPAPADRPAEVSTVSPMARFPLNAQAANATAD